MANLVATRARQKRENGHDRGDSDTDEEKVRPRSGRTIDVSVLVLPTVHASALYGGHDVLSSAGIRWDRSSDRIRCEPRLRVSTVGQDRSPVEAWNGVRVHPDCGLEDVQRSDIVYIPALAPPDQPVPPTDPDVRRWIVDQYRQGALLATACSGSIVLAQCGLLDDQPATTHWAYADTFTRCFPKTKLCPDRALVLAGEEHRIVTAGGGSLWQELLLYVIARFLGREAAAQTARLYLMEWGREDQSPYALFLERRQHSDGAIAAAQRYMLEHAADADVLAGARASTELQERTFARRFRTVTGVSPVQYVQEMRIELAKEAIVRADRPLDEIAYDVGYSDPASFRRIFKRLVGMTASAYRRRMAPP
jgi:transcriptional regulator GlxA family with amidase domain